MEEAQPLPPSTSASFHLRSRPDPLLIVCRCFSLVTGVTALLCVVVNALSAWQALRRATDVFGGIFRCYAVVFAVFVIVVETEWGLIFKFLKIFEFWVARGMLQIFVSVMTRAFPDIHGKRRDIVLLQEIASYMLLSCGVVYIVSGVLCLGFLKRARQHKEITRDQAVKNLQELEKQREELEALLIQERS